MSAGAYLFSDGFNKAGASRRGRSPEPSGTGLQGGAQRPRTSGEAMGSTAVIRQSRSHKGVARGTYA